MSSPEHTDSPRNATPASATNKKECPPDEADVWAALREVPDPELGCGIVDLGLVYGLIIDGGKVGVQMTVTTPGCPMAGAITSGVEAAVWKIPGVSDVSVEIVWEPPWHPSMMSEAARRQVGVFDS
jgi:metal-sulfur cluster biosynthetic enzyme